MFKFELTGVDIKTSSTEFGKIESIKLEVPKELYLEVLKEIIVEAPWGKTTDEFLISINQELGSALEKLVPSAFDSNFAEVDVVKKG